MKLIRAAAGVVGLLGCLLGVACASGHYAGVEEFRAEVDRWALLNKTRSAAAEVLRQKGFDCTGPVCSRDLPGFPCNQRLQVTILPDSNGAVESVEIWSIDGELPSQCL